MVERIDGNIPAAESVERHEAEIRLRGLGIPSFWAPGNEFVYTLFKEMHIGSLPVGLATPTGTIRGVQGSSRLACSLGRQKVGAGP